MNFAKKLFLGSVVAMGAFGLIACGDDSSSNANNSSDTPVIIGDNTDSNIIVTGVKSRVSASTVRFEGIYSLNLTDETNENSSNLKFTNIEYAVTDANMIPVNATVSSKAIAFPTTSIDLNSQLSAFVTVDLNDAAFTTCGTFNLIVKVTANDGAQDYFNTQVISFERNALEYCKEEETPSSSSAAEPASNEIPMVSCEVEVSTNVKPGIDLANCAALEVAQSDAADILFTKVTVSGNSEVVVTSNTGTLFTPITNSDKLPSTDDYEVDFWPEDVNNRSAYVSDFHFKTIAGDKIENLIENAAFIYIAKTTAYNATTGAGFYPFAVTKYSENNHKHFNMTIKIYKAQ